MTDVSQHDIDKFLQEGAYLLNVKVYRGHNQISLNPEMLGLNEEAAKEFAKQKITKNTIRILSYLKKAGERIENLRRKLQNEYMFRSGGLFFTHEKDMEKVYEIIKEMESKRDEAIEELKESKYEEGKQDFKERLFKALEKSLDGDLDRIAAAIVDAEKHFPSIEEVEKNFRIEVLGPFRIESVADIAKRDAKVAKSLAEKVESETIANFKIQQAKKLEQSVVDAMQSAKLEVGSLMAECLETISTVSDSSIPTKLRNRYTQILDKFARLSQFDSSMEELLDQMEAIEETFDKFGTHEFNNCLEKMKKSVLDFHSEVSQTKANTSDSMLF